MVLPSFGRSRYGMGPMIAPLILQCYFSLRISSLLVCKSCLYSNRVNQLVLISRNTNLFVLWLACIRHLFSTVFWEQWPFEDVSCPMLLKHHNHISITYYVWFLQNRQLKGIRGLFNKSSKRSVDTGLPLRKRSLSDHLLRRTASAPAKGRKKTKMCLAESAEERKSSTGEALQEQEVVAVNRCPRAPLQHRPLSMPLERLLQDQLSLTSPDKPDPITEALTSESRSLHSFCPDQTDHRATLNPSVSEFMWYLVISCIFQRGIAALC